MKASAVQLDARMGRWDDEGGRRGTRGEGRRVVRSPVTGRYGKSIQRKGGGSQRGPVPCAKAAERNGPIHGHAHHRL